MLYYGFGEQARHEHMLNEYKDRYIIIALLKTPPRYYKQYNTTVSSNTELNKRVVRSNTTKDLPNTHRRSTVETAMNPMGQTFPVIHIHLGGNSEQSSSPTHVFPRSPALSLCLSLSPGMTLLGNLWSPMRSSAPTTTTSSCAIFTVVSMPSHRVRWRASL